jgi:hypothetical protein
MNFFTILKEVFALANGLGKEVAPGVVGPADMAIKDLLELITKIAHPNTIAYKVAVQGLTLFPAS